MMTSDKIAQMVLLREKGVGRAIDKKYLQKKSPEPLVQSLNNFTEMVLKWLIPKMIRRFSLAEQHGYQS